MKSYNKYFLVTTAEELSWNHDRPTLFLGEWCRLFSRRHVWTKLENKVHPYHWDDRDKFYRDYKFLEALYEKELRRLSTCLGTLHDVSSNVRYWRIIIGPWLRFFIDALFDRFESIRSVLENDLIDDTWILDYNIADWIPNDFSDFYRQFTNDPWNHIVFAECIRTLKGPFTAIDHKLNVPPAIDSTTTQFKQSARKLLELYGRILPARLNRIAIISANIPSADLCKLQLSLSQLPYIKSPSVNVCDEKIDYDSRLTLDHDVIGRPFETILNKLIVNWIPKTYVENFDRARATAFDIFPKKPKVIFTANAYQADDGFKLWGAHHVMNNVPLVIGQHGGNMGIARFNQTEDHQVQIADIFASWGWTRESRPNIKPMPAQKLAAKKPKRNNRGDILVTTASYPRYFYCHYSVPVAGQYLGYIHDQMRFIKQLDHDAQKLLKFRFDDDKFGWDIINQFKETGLGAHIDSYRGSFLKRLNNCRLSVSTSNSTIFLETLAINYPTLIFIDPNRFEIRSDAQAAMDRLRKVGILHDSPESAAVLLNSIYSDVQGWWYDSELQDARRTFCKQYALTSTDWIEQWKDFFNRLANNADSRLDCIA